MTVTAEPASQDGYRGARAKPAGVAELRFAVNRWASKLREQGRITDGQALDVLTIVFGER